MKKIISIILSFLLMVSFSGCTFFEDIRNIGEVKTIMDINKYGEFPALKYGCAIKPYTEHIMPEKIESFFLNPIYYFGYCNEPFMNEMYLEFSIQDEEQYQSYIQEVIKNNPTETFFYDESYKEYVFTDVLGLQHIGEKNGPTIAKSEVQKILFSDESNTIIFISLVVPYNDMPFRLKDFYYFEKFNIEDVVNYYNGANVCTMENKLEYLY